MYQKLFFVFAIAAYLSMGIAAVAQEKPSPGLSMAPMPEVIHFPQGGYDGPIFVAASRLVLSNGSPNPEFPHYASYVKDLQEASPISGKTCLDPHSSTEWETGSGLPRDLKSALETSETVLLAEVTGRQPGFLTYEIAGTLIRFEPIEPMRGSLPLSYQRYFFSKSGNFSIGNKSICKNHPGYPAVPEVGDRVLLLFDDHWFNESGVLILPGSTGSITLKANGTVSLPANFRKDNFSLKAAANSDLLLEKVRHLLRGVEHHD